MVLTQNDSKRSENFKMIFKLFRKWSKCGFKLWKVSFFALRRPFGKFIGIRFFCQIHHFKGRILSRLNIQYQKLNYWPLQTFEPSDRLFRRAFRLDLGFRVFLNTKTKVKVAWWCWSMCFTYFLDWSKSIWSIFHILGYTNHTVIQLLSTVIDEFDFLQEFDPEKVSFLTLSTINRIRFIWFNRQKVKSRREFIVF